MLEMESGSYEDGPSELLAGPAPGPLVLRPPSRKAAIGRAGGAGSHLCSPGPCGPSVAGAPYGKSVWIKALAWFGCARPAARPYLCTLICRPQAEGLLGARIVAHLVLGSPHRPLITGGRGLDVSGPCAGGPGKGPPAPPPTSVPAWRTAPGPASTPSLADPAPWNMALPRAVLLAGLLVEVASKASGSVVSPGPVAGGLGSFPGASHPSASGATLALAPAALTVPMSGSERPCLWRHQLCPAARSSLLSWPNWTSSGSWRRVSTGLPPGQDPSWWGGRRRSSQASSSFEQGPLQASGSQVVALCRSPAVSTPKLESSVKSSEKRPGLWERRADPSPGRPRALGFVFWFHHSLETRVFPFLAV